ncbi:Cyclic AMP-dependent transcription factor ATF-7, partial [Corvus brachyrhynchos]
GALDMSLPSTPDIKIKEEEPVEGDSSPPDSPASRPRSPQHKDKEGPSKPVILSTPTPTIVRPGSLPLHLGYDPLHPTLPSPTSVITQAPPSNRQLGEFLQSCSASQPSCPSSPRSWPGRCPWCRTFPAFPGLPSTAAGPSRPQGSRCTPKPKWLKASLTASSSLNGGSLVVGSASTMVTARPEQSQILVQHPDAPSPAQPPGRKSSVTTARRGPPLPLPQIPQTQELGWIFLGQGLLGLDTRVGACWKCERGAAVGDGLVCLSRQNEVTLLRNEVAQLKQLLLAHKDCPVTALQKKTQGYLGE